MQGGIFHIVMAMAYRIAACDPARQERLVVFIVLVKMTATVFLLLYWAVVRARADDPRCRAWSTAAMALVIALRLARLAA